MRKALAAAVVLVAGCDAMFKLKHLDGEPPVPPDATDAPVCGSPDEDGDCIANDVDNCPSVANEQQTITAEAGTTKGAGDACDPVLTSSGDYVKRFTGFDDPAVDEPQWEPVSTWTFEAGQLHKNVISPQGIVRYLSVDDDDDLTIEAGFVVHAFSSDITARLAVFADIGVSPDIDGQICYLAPNENRVYVAEDTNETDPQLSNSKAVDIPLLPPDAQVVLQFRRNRSAGSIRCVATINGVSYETSTIRSAGNTWLTMGHVALQAKELLADAHYVTVYAR